jgi:hypothetical protein
MVLEYASIPSSSKNGFGLVSIALESYGRRGKCFPILQRGLSVCLSVYLLIVRYMIPNILQLLQYMKAATGKKIISNNVKKLQIWNVRKNTAVLGDTGCEEICITHLF